MSSRSSPSAFRLDGARSLLTYLSGCWQVERSLTDHASGLTGTFTGTATFAPDDDAPGPGHGHDDGAPGDGLLRHRERGTLTWAGSRTVPASRDLLWRPYASSAEVFFADGRPFHGLDLSTGEDFPVHPCAPDHYRGTFLLDDVDRWQYTWRVTGPHKDLTLATRLRRER